MIFRGRNAIAAKSPIDPSLDKGKWVNIANNKVGKFRYVPVFSVMWYAVSILTVPEKFKYESIYDYLVSSCIVAEENTRSVRKVSDLRLYLPARLWGCCALRICYKRSDDQQRILRWSSEKIARCREKKTTAFLVKLLHHDNAPAPSSNLLQQFLAKHKIVQLRQPLYSPDIAPCDFWMFPKLKIALKGKRFDDIE